MTEKIKIQLELDAEECFTFLYGRGTSQASEVFDRAICKILSQLYVAALEAWCDRATAEAKKRFGISS